MFAINITQLVIFNAESGEVLGVYVNAMPLVLVSRFMMNLRQVAGPADSFSISTVAFQANTDMLGNIAEPIEFHVTQASSVGSSETRCSEDGEIPMFTLREGGTQTYDTTAQHGGSTSA
ncbi:hypothetical protein PsYK624_014260 [Phanerochaete sordida]|uniref:Uncharacterized protein n=1 Tax=Phanerochaete sordida TaxID=48140 RepID=A0A9P3L946_9APHY|nr:hypothetical protein PsYK624_014260 [Phanerochaete sordida]